MWTMGMRKDEYYSAQAWIKPTNKVELDIVEKYMKLK